MYLTLSKPILMKKIILSIAISTMYIATYGQIKVFSDGKSSIGSSVSPTSFGLGHLVIASSTGFLSSTLQQVSSPMIKGNNSYSIASAPDYTWLGNTNTGLFHPAINTMALSTNGVESMRLFNDGTVSIGINQNWASKLMVYAGNSTAFSTYVAHTADYGFAQASYVTRALTKGLVVVYNGASTFNVYGNGWVEATGYTTTSDISLKENIHPLDSCLRKVLRLNGVSYNYKQKPLSPNAIASTVINTGVPEKQIGLIAQQVETVVPEVVRTNENGLKSVAYQNLVSLLIEAIKEQQQQIDTLNTQIDALRMQIEQCCAKPPSNGLRMGNTNPDGNNNVNDQKSYLLQNKPNPFSEKTIIEYFIAENENNAAIMIFDLNGKLMHTETVKTTGKGSITVNGNTLSPGMYYYSLVIRGVEIDTKKMIFTTKH